MPVIRKLVVLTALALFLTVFSGFSMEPLMRPSLVGVGYRGFPLAWIKQIVYPGAPMEFIGDAFLMDFAAWFLIIALVFLVFKKL